MGRAVRLSGPFRGAFGTLSLFFLAALSVHAQWNWTFRSIAPAEDLLARPAITIGPDFITHVVYLTPDDRRHWYLNDWPTGGGLFGDRQLVERGDLGMPFVPGATQILLVDSGSRPHYLTALGSSSPCLRYAFGQMTGSGALRGLSEPCTELEDSASAAVDHLGRVHVAYRTPTGIAYRRFNGAQGWSAPVPVMSSNPVVLNPRVAIIGRKVIVLYGAASSSAGGTVQMLVESGDVDNFAGTRSLALVGTTLSGAKMQMAVDNIGLLHILLGRQQQGGLIVTHRSFDPTTGSTSEISTLLQRSDLEVTAMSAVVDRYGAMHVIVGTGPLGSGTAGPLFYITNAGIQWSNPVEIEPGSRFVARDGGNGFAAVRDSLLAFVLQRDNSAQPEVFIARTTLDFAPTLDLPSDTVDFGVVVIGEVSIISVPVINRGFALYERLRLSGISQPGQPFTATGFLPPGGVPGGDSASLALIFSPTATGIFTETIIVESNGGRDTLVLTGQARSEAARRRQIQLSSATTWVGQTATITCRINPPINAWEGIDSFAVTLSVDPDALFPQRLDPSVSSAGSPASSLKLDYGRDGQIVVSSDASSGPLDGSVLFAIELEGLLTGEPRNTVQVDEAILVSRSGQYIDSITGVSGVVTLNGCDLGTGDRYGRYATYPMPNPVDETLHLRYFATDGMPASVHLRTISGEILSEHVLPVGTGKVAIAEITLEGVPSGPFLLEFVAGSRRDIVKIFRR